MHDHDPIPRPAKVLLATDLSHRCDRALDRAAACAMEWQAPLLVATVVDQEALAGNWSGAGEAAAVMEAKHRLSDDLASFPGVNHVVKVKTGDVLEQVLAVAGEEHADLVVTGVARNTWFRTVVLGTVVDGLMRHSEIPTLVVRKRVKGPYRKILIAGDLSELSETILRKTLAWFPGAAVAFFHAVDIPNAVLADADGKGLREQARQAAHAEIVSFIDRAGLAPDQRNRVRILCEAGNPIELLNRRLRRESVDLVVVGGRGRGVLFEIFIGSKSKQIVENIASDVLVVRQ